MKEITKNIIKSMASEVVESATEFRFVTLATAAGFPAVALVLPIAKGLVLGVLDNCFTDNAQKKLYSSFI